ncbi:MAG: hypothetical protein ACP5N9_04665 [Candidatus Bilamarchaeum sp.]|jgi:hypothetical protein
MKKTVFVLVLSIILFGCTSQIQEKQTLQKPQSISTLNISFTRQAEGLLNTETKFPEKPKFEFEHNQNGSIIVSYFYSPTCSGHLAVASRIQSLKIEYSQYDWREYDITTQNGTLAYIAFATNYNKSKDILLVPQVLVNGNVLSDSHNISENLELVLRQIS